MIPAKEIFASDLRGHAYIEARGLSPQLVAAHQHTCPSCKQAEDLPRIQRIVDGWHALNNSELRNL